MMHAVQIPVLPQWMVLDRWVVMWTIALGIYGGCKCLTLAVAQVPATPMRKVAYLICSFGMNANAFLAGAKSLAPPSMTQVIRPLVHMTMGGLLV